MAWPSVTPNTAAFKSSLLGRLGVSGCHNAAMHPDALNEALGHASSDRRLEVLRRVAQSGSISQAAREVGVSYKAAWQAIDTLTTLSGAVLVARTVGGAGGGGAQVTTEGLQLLALAEELSAARQRVLARFSDKTVASGLGLRTSMRNQLPCTVVDMVKEAQGGAVVTVILHTPGGLEIFASLTHESADLLGIGEGLQVLALSKATAVKVLARGASPVQLASSRMSGLPGEVVRVSEGQGWSEVAMALAGGGSWVGFAPGDGALRVGDSCTAWVESSAVVIALGS